MASSSKSDSKGFASKLGFILAASGSAVGLGNLWRFPWQVSKYGGGAFVFTYIFMVLFLGIIVMIAEVLIGRIGRSSLVDSYGKINKNLKWVGILAIFVPFFISCYYTVIGGWSIKYALNYLAVGKNFYSGDAAPYFTNFVTSKAMAPIFSLIFMVITIIIVAKGVDKGIEKASKILMPALAAIVIILAIFAVSNSNREGVGKGLKFYIGSFDFKALGFNGIIAAMSQAFFSLSLGMGAMVAYGSYTGRKLNLGKSAITIATFDTLFALMAGFIIFPSVYALLPNPDLDSLKGAGLVFIVLPEVFKNMGRLGSAFGFAFFILVSFAALTSLISLLEVVSQYAILKFKVKRKTATWILGGIMGIISLFVSLSQNGTSFQAFGYDLLTYLDEITNTVLLPFVGAMSLISVGWCLKKETLMQYINSTQSDFKAKQVWYFLAKFISPILAIIVLIMGLKGNFTTVDKETGKNFFNKQYLAILFSALFLVLVSVIANIIWNSKKYIAWEQAKFGNIVSTLDAIIAEEEKAEEED